MIKPAHPGVPHVRLRAASAGTVLAGRSRAPGALLTERAGRPRAAFGAATAPEGGAPGLGGVALAAGLDATALAAFGAFGAFGAAFAATFAAALALGSLGAFTALAFATYETEVAKRRPYWVGAPGALAAAASRREERRAGGKGP